MPLTNDQETRIKALSPVLDEHAAWFSRTIRQVFFPEEKQGKDALGKPENFDQWLDEVHQNYILSDEEAARFHELYAEMVNAAAELTRQTATTKENPRLHQFDSFVALYNQFIERVREVERKQSLAGHGIDPLTGLYNQTMMMVNLEKEMELLARRGRPFSVILARIDNYEKIRKAVSVPQHEEIVRHAGEIIKLCIRSFDEAYRLADGEFLMCLKQAEKSGGSAGVNRLRKLLQENVLQFNAGGEKMTLSMSSCVAEPQAGEKIEDLLLNMRDDLNRYGGGAQTALEYFELSPLQRFIHDADTSKKSH